MTNNGKIEPGDKGIYRGICEARRGQLCQVTHTGILGLHSVQFEDGGGFLCQPRSIEGAQDVAQAA